jgi:hypothetical protein
MAFVLASVHQGHAQHNSVRDKPKTWVPSTGHFQFAGFMGMFSAGAGYHYMNKRLNTSLLYGYVPQSYSTRSIHTLALKNTIAIVNGSRFLKSSVTVQPVVYGGFTVNCEISRHSFFTLPDYYPKGYYHNQAVHLTFFTGIRTHILIGKEKRMVQAIEPFAEIGTLDTYLWYYVSGGIHADDILRLALGVNFFFR